MKQGDYIRYITGKSKVITRIEIDNQIPNYVGITSGENVHIDDCEHWIPEENEVFWGVRELPFMFMYKERLELFVLYKIHDDGTLSLKSPLDRNVYSYYIEPEDVDRFLSKCAPFIGTMPDIEGVDYEYSL